MTENRQKTLERVLEAATLVVILSLLFLFLLGVYALAGLVL